MTDRTAGMCRGRRGVLLVSLGLAVSVMCVAGQCRPLIESPMSFSPDGRGLALTTIEPLVTDASDFLAGRQVFRLMVVSGQGQLRILEERTDALLTGPGYSPDGRRICYLRIPLLTEEQQDAQSHDVERRLKPLDAVVDHAWVQWWSAGGYTPSERTSAMTSQPIKPQPADAPDTPDTQPADTPDTQPTSAPTSRPAIEIVDAALPPVTGAFSPLLNTVFLPSITAQLVVRDISSGEIACEMPVELPSPDHRGIYMATQPHFDPGGKWVYFATGQTVMAVDPASREKRVLAIGSDVVSLSPDGKTLAVYIQAGEGQHIIGLLATDGQTALYRRLPFTLCTAPNWTDNDTLMLLATEQKSSPASQPAQAAASQPDQPDVLLRHSLGSDGTLSPGTRIVLPKPTEDTPNVSNFAVAPDGRHLVVDNHLMTLDSRPVAALHGDQGTTLAQPVFSPDSRRLAFKVMRTIGDKKQRAEAVVLYDIDGNLLHKVDIPPGATRPTSTQGTDGE